MSLHQKNELDISHNHLLDLKLDSNEDLLKSLKLKRLDSSFNRLTFLSPIIFALGNLVDLNVSHNDLCNLPKELSKMESLRKLDVSFNSKLFYLPKPPSLLHLNISSTAIQLTEEYKSTIASIVEENTSPVPGISDLASSSDGDAPDTLLRTQIDENDEKLRIFKRQEEEKQRVILAKEQAQANYVKELAARDRAKNEELEDKTMRLALIEAEEENKAQWKRKLLEFEDECKSLSFRLLSEETERKKRVDFIDLLKKREAEDAEHFKLTQEQESKVNVEFAQRQMMQFLQNEEDFARMMNYHQNKDLEDRKRLKAFAEEEESMKQKRFALMDSVDNEKCSRQNLEEREYFQKLACQRAIEQNDMELRDIRRNAEMVKLELEKITVMEVDRQSVENKEMMLLLEERRMEMSSLLGKFLKDEKVRQEQAREYLDQIEKSRQQNEAMFWVRQFETLMQSKPIALQRMEASMDRRVLRIIQRAGAIDSLECFGAHNISFGQLKKLTHKDLERIGVYRLGDRLRILEQVLLDDGEDENASAPKVLDTPAIEQAENASAPPASIQSSTSLPADQQVFRAENECCICMESCAQICFLPCGHVCTCNNCAVPLENCPICRGPVSDKIQILS